MTEPAIPTERSEAKVPNAPNGQTSLSLWPDRDPNLYQVGLYEFEIEANKLKKVLKAAVLPKSRAPFLFIEVSRSALKIISQTKDASFDISPSVPLLQCAEIGSVPITFEVARELMMNFAGETKYGPIYVNQLAFTFDRNSSSLSWSERGRSGSYSIEARWVPPAAPEAGLRQLAVISRDVGGGIRYAATLIQRKSSPDFPYEGVRIEGGSITGGYPCGVSRCRCPLLPESLALNVPKDHVANVLALFSRMAGRVEVLESDSRIHLRAHLIEGSWKRMDPRPGSLNRAFEVSPLQTVRVVTTLLQKETYFMAALFKEQLRVTIENCGAYGRVVLSASSKIGRGMTRALKGELVSNGADNQRPWDLTINAKDLRDAALATTTTYTALSIIDQGLLVQPEGTENECKTILLGRERQ